MSSESVDFVELTQNEMSNIYTKLSVNCNDNFDVENYLNKIESFISEIYDSNFLLIETKDLQTNIVLLNNSFVSLLKFSLSKHCKNVSYIFVGYCDYFSLDFEKTFSSLHEKLQILIKNSSKQTIGDKIYSKYNKQKNNGNNLRTLFDLVNK